MSAITEPRISVRVLNFVRVKAIGGSKNVSHFVELIAVVLTHFTECQNSTRMSKFLGLEDMTNLIFVGLDFCI